MSSVYQLSFLRIHPRPQAEAFFAFLCKNSVTKQIENTSSWEHSINEQYRDFLACLESEEDHKSSAASHLATMAFVEAAYKSIEQRQPINPLLYGSHMES